MMNKLRVMTIFGTRPEAVKMAPLVKAIDACPDMEGICCVTAQHREMLDSVLAAFALRPRYDLNIMEQNQSLHSIAARVLTLLSPILHKEKPDLLLVHGDTTTTLAAALTAGYAQIPVGHVEAGLRTHNKRAPFPEEINRLVAGVLADWHFCPTARNKENLLKENITKGVFVTGNTAIDAMKYTVDPQYRFAHPLLRELDFNRRVLVVTAHRRENLGRPLHDIMQALHTILENYPDTTIVYPVHLNPAVQQAADRGLGRHPRAHLIEPLDVVAMHNLMGRCHMVITDSGGLQEEAPGLGKPVLVLRNETERQEAVDAGTVLLAGTDAQRIVDLASRLLDDAAQYQSMARALNPYGDGNACRRIVQALRYLHGISQEQPEEFGC